jgi:predicted RNA-binding protein with PUA-like domain
MLNPQWLIIGPERSWSAAFDLGGIWGVKERLYPEWKALDPGDMVFFYVTSPVSGVVGVGNVTNKFIQDKPLWPDELEANKVIYPYRFEFDIAYALEKDRWKADRIKVPLTVQELKRGINVLLERSVKHLASAVVNDWGHELHLKGSRPPSQQRIVAEGKEPPNHTEAQQLIYEIGRMNRLISEKEYPIAEERLDVVWRRIERSVPTYAFEVQVGGDVYHALGKLKHANDLWNSKMFLVAAEDQLPTVRALLRGTFNEIEQRLGIISLLQVQELHGQKSKWVTMERQIGLL